MSNRNTVLFAVSMLTAVGAIAADHLTSAAPTAVAGPADEGNPCAAAAPPPAPGERNYDDVADSYSSGSGQAAPVPAASPAREPADANPCSAGVL